MKSSNIDWSPVAYEKACVLAREAGEEILSRLGWMTLQPKLIVDIGCGTGELSACLKTYYPAATVLALDASHVMVKHAHQQHTEIHCGCAEATILPIRDQAVDLIVANFLVPWHADAQALLREWYRVLHPDGLLIFTALGPDTLKAWQTVFAPTDMPVYVDMHDIGDLLLYIGFTDPVLEVAHYTLTYSEQAHFFQELKASGMWFPPESHVVNGAQGSYEATYEVIFAHAFAPNRRKVAGDSSDDGMVKISLSALRGQLLKK